MFSKIIRLGVAISGAAILSSCGGGSGQTLTQQSTPEGLFSSTSGTPLLAPTVTYLPTNVIPGAPVPASCTQSMLVFVEYSGLYFSFNFAPTGTNSTNPIAPVNLISASSGSLSFSNGTMSSGNVIEVTPPNTVPGPALPNPPYQPNTPAPHGFNCNVAILSNSDVYSAYPATVPPTTVALVDNEATSPSLTGGYSTGLNIAGTFNYPVAIDAAGDFKATNFNINYDTDYQGVQSLATLAGTYTGTVATSQLSEAATFTFGPASVPANSQNQFGVGIVSGTGASGCVYTGTVSPLFKGNGYNLLVTSGAPPCLLPGTQFSGLVYLNTTTNYLYSFSPNGVRNDGLIFTGVRK